MCNIIFLKPGTFAHLISRGHEFKRLKSKVAVRVLMLQLAQQPTPSALWLQCNTQIFY